MHLYGVSVPALIAPNDLIGPRRHVWHTVHLEYRRGAPPVENGLELGIDRCTISAAGAYSVMVSRAVGFSSWLQAPEPVAEAVVVHPLMSFVGAVVAAWTDRTALHAGAVLMGGRAWLLVAPPTGGKSTIATGLHLRGHPIISDDLSVLQGRTVFAGPRTADLRAAAAGQLGLDTADRGAIRDDRWRVGLDPVPAEVQLGGVFHLTFGDGVALEPVRAAERLALLAEADGLGFGPERPMALLDLIDVPTYRLTRTRDWSTFEPALRLLEDAASSALRTQP